MIARRVRFYLNLVVMAVLLITSGCGEMQEKELIAVASKYAAEKGLEVELYKASVAETKTAWQVHFVRDHNQYKPAPGDFFTVIIDKNSKIASEIVYGK